ncbi:MAG: hypothetical protein EKK42_20355 [Pseudonocardiaceae bacterium]|nr:MAG: hypothetical protein EKK42_20355 [Pseudonocardiaceae bacterium]
MSASEWDARSILDLRKIVADARPKVRQIPETSYTPPATDGDPNPVPVTVPARMEVYTDPDDLPAVMTGSSGTVDLAAQVSVLQALVVRMLEDMQIRRVVGRVTLAPTVPVVYQPSSPPVEFPVTWDTVPLEKPTGGTCIVNAAISWLGKVSATVKPDSLSMTGCTVVMKPLATVVPNTANPITIEVQAEYFYLPPYSES